MAQVNTIVRSTLYMKFIALLNPFSFRKRLYHSHFEKSKNFKPNINQKKKQTLKKKYKKIKIPFSLFLTYNHHFFLERFGTPLVIKI